MASLGETELKSLVRIGDIFLPGDAEFPSFSASGCVEHVNLLAAEADPTDLGDLALFLRIMAVMPTVILRFFCFLLMKADSFPEFMAVPLRQLNIALRGMIISPYFSNLTGDNFKGRDPNTVMGYELTRVED